MEFRSVTPEAIVETALQRWNTAREASLREQAEYEARRIAETRRRASTDLADKLELPRNTLPPEAWSVELGEEFDRARVDFAGLRWEWTNRWGDGALHLVQRCELETCGFEENARVDGLASLGRWLAEEPSLEHAQHASAKPRTPAAAPRRPEPPTPGELLIEAVRAVVREELRYAQESEA